MLSCTYTLAPLHNGPYMSYMSLIKMEILNSTGACLKMCLEEFSECIQIDVAKRAGEYECYFYKASEEGVYSYDTAGVEYYNLDRGAINDSCPLAETVFPALG
ncbi:unnamed protein product [Haemonchus placei]|uniref:Apple domain-containing protein n=1 Tax=Haemonchus placei TaxID=6290 RepID=A0A0N4WN60_HAEPC|nr:unnamed protein product [Haemonchus placei]